MTTKVTEVVELPKKSFIKTYATKRNLGISLIAVAAVVLVGYAATKFSDEETVDVNPTV
jgi:hypothetical protein